MAKKDDFNKLLGSVFKGMEGISNSAEDIYKQVHQGFENFKKKNPDFILGIISRFATSMSQEENSVLHHDVILNRPKLLIKHLAQGEDPDSQREHDGLTTLHLASFLGKKDMVEILLKAGADPNVLSIESSFTALHAAIRSQNLKDVSEIAKLLIRYGARADLKDGQGDTAFKYVDEFKNPNWIKEMLKNLEQSKIYETLKNILKDTEQFKNKWDGYHKVITAAELPGIDVVELRHALNNNQYNKVSELIEKNSLDYHYISDWAKYHSYEDKVGSIEAMCEYSHHEEL